MEKFPVLIGGCPRSGTTALWHFLNSAKGVYISSEENIFNLLSTLRPLLSTTERRMKVTDEGMRALSTRESLKQESMYSHNFSKTSVWKIVRSIYRVHFNQNNDDESKLAIWGDKYPLYYKEMEKEVFQPWIKYIHIVRNPYDTINSMIRRTELAKEGKDWWSAITNVEDMITAWEEAFNLAETLSYRDNVLYLHYEDLIFKRDEVIEKINQFIGYELEFTYPLESELDLHFTREYLDQDTIVKLQNSMYVSKYFAKYQDDKFNPNILME